MVGVGVQEDSKPIKARLRNIGFVFIVYFFYVKQLDTVPQFVEGFIVHNETGG